LRAILGLPPIPRPDPPAGITVFFQDADGRPCKAEAAYLWTWSHAPTWYYAHRHHPPPVALAFRAAVEPDYCCPKCGFRQSRVEVRRDKNGRPHLWAVCPMCGKSVAQLSGDMVNVDLEYRSAAGVTA
jgi:hypothetical protein